MMIMTIGIMTITAMMSMATMMTILAIVILVTVMTLATMMTMTTMMTIFFDILTFDIFNKLHATRIHSLSNISPFYGKSIPTDVYKSFQTESRVFKREKYLIFLFGTTLSPSLFACLWWHRSKGRHEGPQKWWITLPRNPFFVDLSKYSQQTPLSWSNNKNNKKKVNFGKRKPYYRILGCYTILKQ